MTDYALKWLEQEQQERKRKIDNRPNVWAELERRNIVKVEVYFSGGNDEGDCDAMIATKTDGEQEQLALTNYADQVGDPLEDDLYFPIEEQYGSYAGEYWVRGVLVWDVASRSINLLREESTTETVEECIEGDPSDESVFDYDDCHWR